MSSIHFFNELLFIDIISSVNLLLFHSIILISNVSHIFPLARREFGFHMDNNSLTGRRFTFFTFMDLFLMSDFSILFTEKLATIFALMWLFSCVNGHMGFELALLNPSLVAMWTHKRSVFISCKGGFF